MLFYALQADGLAGMLPALVNPSQISNLLFYNLYIAGADAEFVDRGGTHQIVDGGKGGGAPKRVPAI